MKVGTLILLVLFGGCASHDLRVVMKDGACTAYRDGVQIGSRWSPGTVVDAPGSMR